MKNQLKTFMFGALHSIIAFPAITLVSTAMGMSVATAFLLAGIGTLLFHVITKNKLPSVLGVSGAFIGAILFITGEFGAAAVGSGVIAAGVIYILLGLFAYFMKDRIYDVFPKWILDVAIVLIALTLLPIGQGLAMEAPQIALITILMAVLASLSKKSVIKSSAMFIALATATVASVLVDGATLVPTIETISFITPEFNLTSIVLMGSIAVITFFEMLGDIRNTSNIIGMDVVKEVGIHRVALGNGVAQIVSGTAGGPVYTTYSENAGALLTTGFFNPNAQIWTGIIFIALAIVSTFLPILSFLQLIPMAAFGGVLLFLYGSVFMNVVANLSKEEFHKSQTKVLIAGAIIAISYLQFEVGMIVISGLATAMILGVIFAAKEKKHIVKEVSEYKD